MKRTIYGVVTLLLALGFNGCSSHRSQSGITVPTQSQIKPEIIVTESSMENKNCTTLKTIDASVKKLTLFHADPTKEQVNYILAKKGKTLNANAVRNVKYTSGVGITTWGYIDATGDASKCNLDK